jgi:retinol-binding protein 3
LHERLAAGAYDADSTAPLLGEALVREMQAVSPDLHLRLSYEPGRELGSGTAVRTRRIDGRDSSAIARTNFGFSRVELLAGNVGYLKLDRFVPLDYSRATAVAAMSFLAGTDAVIVDLRDNIGGSPDLLQLLLSYFVEPEPVLLYASYNRALDVTNEQWTLREVPGRRMVRADLWVLVGEGTGSAAEAFGYAVRRLERGTLVGRPTAGAGNGGSRQSVGAGIALFVPEWRVTTGPGWEGTGVVPQVRVPTDSAPVVAHRLALERLYAQDSVPEVRRERAWALELARAERPYTPAPAELQRYVGRFEARELVLDGGQLVEVGASGWRSRLTPVAPGVFRDGSDRRLRFELAAAGRAIRVTIDFADGRPTRTERMLP